jgi:hypothetical protein
MEANILVRDGDVCWSCVPSDRANGAMLAIFFVLKDEEMYIIFENVFLKCDVC